MSACSPGIVSYYFLSTGMRLFPQVCAHHDTHLPRLFYRNFLKMQALVAESPQSSVQSSPRTLYSSQLLKKSSNLVTHTHAQSQSMYILLYLNGVPVLRLHMQYFIKMPQSYLERMTLKASTAYGIQSPRWART